MNQDDWEHYNDVKREYGLEDRVSIVLRMQTEDGFYPINELRNLAIRYSTTSHFFLSDMDMWPSFELYEALKALPSFILQDDFFSGIVPAFEVKKPECDSIEKCVEKLHLWSVLMDRVAPMLPRTKPELIACLKSKMCSLYRENKSTHVRLQCLGDA